MILLLVLGVEPADALNSGPSSVALTLFLNLCGSQKLMPRSSRLQRIKISDF